MARIPAPDSSASMGYNLGAIMAAITLVGLGGAYLLLGVIRDHAAGERPSSERVLVSLTGRDLTIPAGWLAPGQDFGVSGYSKDVRLVLPLGSGSDATTISATILQRSRVRTSASLLDGVYLHQFQDKEIPGPPGLVGKPLKAEEGYQNETVWYDPIGTDPFVAKCAPVGEGAAPVQCLRTVNLGAGLAAVYSFSPEALAQWRSFDEKLAPMLKAIGAL